MSENSAFPRTQILDYDKFDIKLLVQNETEARYRLNSCKREPDTVKWIESLPDGAVFFDIGANTGSYSLVAAAQNIARNKNIQIVAFEPAQVNFRALLRNIRLNDFDQFITPINIGLSNRSGLTVLNYHDGGGQYPVDESGSSGHQIGRNIDYQGNSFSPILKQNVAAMTLDDFSRIFEVVPTFVKIDVDGLEDAILDGAGKLLKNSRLLSVLVEINTESLLQNSPAKRIFRRSSR